MNHTTHPTYSSLPTYPIHSKNTTYPQILLEDYNPNYKPTEDELYDYATFLNIDIIRYPSLKPILLQGITAPLPGSWCMCKSVQGDQIIQEYNRHQHHQYLLNKSKLNKHNMVNNTVIDIQPGDTYFYNVYTGAILREHPCDAYYQTVIDYAIEEIESQRTQRQVETATLPLSNTTQSQSQSQSQSNLQHTTEKTTSLYLEAYKFEKKLQQHIEASSQILCDKANIKTPNPLLTDEPKKLTKEYILYSFDQYIQGNLLQRDGDGDGNIIQKQEKETEVKITRKEKEKEREKNMLKKQNAKNIKNIQKGEEEKLEQKEKRKGKKDMKENINMNIKQENINIKQEELKIQNKYTNLQLPQTALLSLKHTQVQVQAEMEAEDKEVAKEERKEQKEEEGKTYLKHYDDNKEVSGFSNTDQFHQSEEPELSELRESFEKFEKLEQYDHQETHSTTTTPTPHIMPMTTMTSISYDNLKQIPNPTHMHHSKLFPRNRISNTIDVETQNRTGNIQNYNQNRTILDSILLIPKSTTEQMTMTATKTKPKTTSNKETMKNPQYKSSLASTASTASTISTISKPSKSRKNIQSSHTRQDKFIAMYSNIDKQLQSNTMVDIESQLHRTQDQQYHQTSTLPSNQLVNHDQQYHQTSTLPSKQLVNHSGEKIDGNRIDYFFYKKDVNISNTIEIEPKSKVYPEKNSNVNNTRNDDDNDNDDENYENYGNYHTHQNAYRRNDDTANRTKSKNIQSSNQIDYQNDSYQNNNTQAIIPKSHIHNKEKNTIFKMLEKSKYIEKNQKIKLNTEHSPNLTPNISTPPDISTLSTISFPSLSIPSVESMRSQYYSNISDLAQIDQLPILLDSYLSEISEKRSEIGEISDILRDRKCVLMNYRRQLRQSEVILTQYRTQWKKLQDFILEKHKIYAISWNGAGAGAGAGAGKHDQVNQHTSQDITKSLHIPSFIQAFTQKLRLLHSNQNTVHEINDSNNSNNFNNSSSIQNSISTILFEAIHFLEKSKSALDEKTRAYNERVLQLKHQKDHLQHQNTLLSNSIQALDREESSAVVLCEKIIAINRLWHEYDTNVKKDILYDDDIPQIFGNQFKNRNNIKDKKNANIIKNLKNAPADCKNGTNMKKDDIFLLIKTFPPPVSTSLSLSSLEYPISIGTNTVLDTKDIKSTKDTRNISNTLILGEENINKVLFDHILILQLEEYHHQTCLNKQLDYLTYRREKDCVEDIEGILDTLHDLKALTTKTISHDLPHPTNVGHGHNISTMKTGKRRKHPLIQKYAKEKMNLTVTGNLSKQHHSNHDEDLLQQKQKPWQDRDKVKVALNGNDDNDGDIDIDTDIDADSDEDPDDIPDTLFNQSEIQDLFTKITRGNQGIDSIGSIDSINSIIKRDIGHNIVERGIENSINTYNNYNLLDKDNKDDKEDGINDDSSNDDNICDDIHKKIINNENENENENIILNILNESLGVYKYENRVQFTPFIQYNEVGRRTEQRKEREERNEANEGNEGKDRNERREEMEHSRDKITSKTTTNVANEMTTNTNTNTKNAADLSRERLRRKLLELQKEKSFDPFASSTDSD